MKENRDLAPIHAAADNMFRDMNTVEQLYKDGQSELADGRPDRAAEPFCEALALDEKLMLAEKVSAPADERKKELDKMISFFRHNTQRDMASHSYQRGKELADREDRKQACRIWKLGFSFWRGQPRPAQGAHQRLHRRGEQPHGRGRHLRRPRRRWSSTRWTATATRSRPRRRRRAQLPRGAARAATSAPRWRPQVDG